MNTQLDYSKIKETKKFYPSDTNRELQLYTLDLDSNNTRYMGSYSYKSGNSSDVDLLEVVEKIDKKDLLDFVTKNLIRVAAQLTKLSGQYLVEVKFGLDHIFSDLNIGKCSHNVYTVPNEFFVIMNNYYSIGLISEKDYELIHEVKFKLSRSQLDFENIKNMIRTHYILRWNYEELKTGYKILALPDGTKYKYSIYSALQDKSPINIEGYYRSYDKYVDISNYLVFQYIENGKSHMLNLSDKILSDFDGTVDQTLKTSIYTLLYSKIASNPMKACKRMLSYSRYFNNQYLLKSSYQIINSQIGSLYNLNSQIKTISKLLDKKFNKMISSDIIYHQLEMIIFNMQSIIINGFNSDKYISILKYVIGSNTDTGYSETVRILTDLSHELGDYINDETIKIMTLKKLYPLPKEMYPNELPF